MGVAALAAAAGFAAQWAPAVSDGFDSHMTFAEEWRTADSARVKSADGRLVFSGKASVRRVGETPNAFRASAKFAVTSGTAGIRCGTAQVVAKAGETKTLTLDCAKGGFKGKPIELFADGEATADDYLVEIPVADNASPNLLVNSGFEHAEDGVSQFFQYRGNLKWTELPTEAYEEKYLKRFLVVEDVKHSGRRALRMQLDPAYKDAHVSEYSRSTGGPLVARPKVPGGINVFSVWMKASVPGVEMEIDYGAKKKVALTADWARYEVSTTNKADHCVIRALGKYESRATVWIDDLQKEVVLPKRGEAYDPAKSYASRYRACDADATIFAPLKVQPPPPAVAVPKLPAGVKPSADYAAWSGSAASVGAFTVGGTKVPNKKTEACVACDDDNLYFGWRNAGEDPAGVTRPRKEGAGHDVTGIYGRDSVELLFKMDDVKASYHFFGAPNGELADKYNDAIGWDGEWSVEGRAADGAVEYLVTIPFKTLAPQGFTRRIRANVCRNDSHDWSMRECIATTTAPGWRNVDGWGAFDLPEDVAAKWIAVARTFVKDDGGAKGPEVMSRLDYYMDEPVARFRIWDEQGALHTASLDISKLPCGTNAVKVEADGRTYETKLVKLPYRDNAIQVNRFARCLQRHGKKILFTGPCLAPRWLSRRKDGSIPEVEMCEKAGFKYFHLATFGAVRDYERTVWLLDDGAKKGYDYLIWTGHVWDKEKLAKNKNLVSAEDYIRGTDRANVVSQMVLDEPELGHPSDWARDWMRRAKRYFPYTPVQMNNTIFGVPSRYAGLETDILMLDSYLTAAQRQQPCFLHPHVDAMLTCDRGKPCWLFLVSDNTSLHYKTPSYGEQVAQSWGCVCWGVTGISWYIGIPSVEPTWRAMVECNREIQSLKDEILSEEDCEMATTPLARKDLAVLTRKTGGTWHVFTCNMTDAAQKKVTVTLGRDAPRNGTVEVLFENRTLQLKDGAFTDTWTPYARHVYRIRKPLKVLMIGNSFSQSVLTKLPALAARAGEPLEIANLMIGGCVLSRHASNVVAFATDPEFKPYGFPRAFDGRRQGQTKTNIPQALSGEKWDVVTIQQGSSQSYVANSYHPWGDELVKTIRKYQPQAKIMVQQTWTYNEYDRTIHDPYTGGPGWFKIDRDTMYRNLTSNYFAFAKGYGFEVIPTGNAVELFRHRAQLKNPADDVVGVFPKPEKGWWDRIHLNADGCQLQAYVWLKALFGKDPRTLQDPKDDRDRLMREVAYDVFSVPPLSIEPYPANAADYAWKTLYSGAAEGLPHGGATPDAFRATARVQAKAGRAGLVCGTSSLTLAADGTLTAAWTDKDGVARTRTFANAVAKGGAADLRLLRVNGGTALWHFILNGKVLFGEDSVEEKPDGDGRFSKLGVIVEGGASIGPVTLEQPIVE